MRRFAAVVSHARLFRQRCPSCRETEPNCRLISRGVRRASGVRFADFVERYGEVLPVGEDGLPALPELLPKAEEPPTGGKSVMFTTVAGCAAEAVAPLCGALVGADADSAAAWLLLALVAGGAGERVPSTRGWLCHSSTLPAVVGGFC